MLYARQNQRKQKFPLGKLVRVRLQKIENTAVQSGIFHQFAQPAFDFPRREGGEKHRIDDHLAGLIKGPDHVFHAAEIHGGFPAHAAVRLREKGGGYLNAGNAPHIQRRRQAADVPHDAAAHGEQPGSTVQSRLRHALQNLEKPLKIFIFFSRGQHENLAVPEVFS